MMRVVSLAPGATEAPATGAARTVVLDGSAYFNRPGPRLVDSLELLAAACTGGAR